jgi:hypothetical protein
MLPISPFLNMSVPLCYCQFVLTGVRILAPEFVFCFDFNKVCPIKMLRDRLSVSLAYTIFLKMLPDAKVMTGC